MEEHLHAPAACEGVRERTRPLLIERKVYFYPYLTRTAWLDGTWGFIL